MKITQKINHVHQANTFSIHHSHYAAVCSSRVIEAAKPLKTLDTRTVSTTAFDPPAGLVHSLDANCRSYKLLWSASELQI